MLCISSHVFVQTVHFPSSLAQTQATDDIPSIMDALFECTLEMINKNLEEFPEHRTNFFRMLQSITQHCFEGLSGLGPFRIAVVVYQLLTVCARARACVCVCVCVCVCIHLFVIYLASILSQFHHSNSL